jgi:hypothetical protein
VGRFKKKIPSTSVSVVVFFPTRVTVADEMGFNEPFSTTVPVRVEF